MFLRWRTSVRLVTAVSFLFWAFMDAFAGENDKNFSEISLPSVSSLPDLPGLPMQAAGVPVLPSLEDALRFMPCLTPMEEANLRTEKKKWALPNSDSMQAIDPRRHGELAWPVQGKISSGFGPRGKGARARMHRGIDIPVARGTPIQASMAGVVVEARVYNGYGKTVVLDHGEGMWTLYAHCAELLVRPGDFVDLGQIIASAGDTGRATTPHLHFGVILAGKFRDPLALLKRTPDRLAAQKRKNPVQTP